MRARAILPCIALVLAGCLESLDPDPNWTEFPALLEMEGVPEDVTAPTTAQRNVPFNVTFTTYGRQCTEMRNDLTVSGLDVHIVSTQLEPDTFCPDALVPRANVVPVTVILPGTANVYVHGRRESDQEIVVVRVVTIAP